MRSRLEKFEEALAGSFDSQRGPLDDVSGIHKYWARKPWRVLDKFITLYSKVGDVIVDPFVGSGATGLQANLLGRKFIGIDLNPFACFLTEQTLSTDFDESTLDKDLRALDLLVGQRIMNLYSVGDRYCLWSAHEPDTGRLRGVTSDRDFRSKAKESFTLETLEGATGKRTIPDAVFPKKFYKDRFSYKGVEKVSDLFTQRNLRALEILWSAIDGFESTQNAYLKLALSNTLLHASILKSERVRPLGVNNYWIPDDHIEENVWWRFTDRVSKLAKSKKAITSEQVYRPHAISDYKVLNQSSLRIPAITKESIDYVFMDPPYGDAIQYSELSFVWNTWLGFSYDTEEEVIVNPVQNKGNSSYLELLDSSLKEVFRILKVNSYATVAFHTRDVNLWLGLAEILGRNGFSLHSINAFPPKGNPFTRNWAKFSPKTDIYITVKKTQFEKAKKTKTVEFSEVSAEIRQHFGDREVTLGLKYDLLVASLFDYRMRGFSIIDLPRKRTLDAMVSAVTS